MFKGQSFYLFPKGISKVQYSALEKVILRYGGELVKEESKKKAASKILIKFGVDPEKEGLVAKDDNVLIIDWISQSVINGSLLDEGEFKWRRDPETSTPHSNNDAVKLDTSTNEGIDNPELLFSEWECQRKTPWRERPLNPGLEELFQHLKKLRILQGEHFRSEAYDRAISGVRALNFTLTRNLLNNNNKEKDEKEKSFIERIPILSGRKISSHINNFFRAFDQHPPTNDQEEKTEEEKVDWKSRIRQLYPMSERDGVIEELMSVHGIGIVKANELYDSFGIRSLDQLEAELEKETGDGEALVKRVKGVRSLREALGTDQMVGLLYRKQLSKPISRSEADELLTRLVNNLSGTTTISTSSSSNNNNSFSSVLLVVPVGGYRRGKKTFHDLDLLLLPYTETPSNQSISDFIKNQGLHDNVHIIRNDFSGPETFLQHPWLKSRIIHQFQRSGVSSGGGGSVNLVLLDATPNKNDIKANEDTPERRIFHVDFVWCKGGHLEFPFMLLGWTGSKRFEQSLRKWAKQNAGVSLSNHGMTPAVTIGDGQEVICYSERDIFKALALDDFIEPIYRNC